MENNFHDLCIYFHIWPYVFFFYISILIYVHKINKLNLVKLFLGYFSWSIFHVGSNYPTERVKVKYNEMEEPAEQFWVVFLVVYVALMLCTEQQKNVNIIYNMYFQCCNLSLFPFTYYFVYSSNSSFAL